MSKQQQYHSPLTRAIVRLIEMAIGNGETVNIVIKIAWKSIKPQLPMMLYSLDHSPEALQAIQVEILKVSQENLLKERGPGYLAWIKTECQDESKRIEPLCPS